MKEKENLSILVMPCYVLPYSVDGYVHVADATGLVILRLPRGFNQLAKRIVDFLNRDIYAAAA